MAARTEQADTEITVVRDSYGWRVVPPRAFVTVGSRVTFKNPTRKEIALYFVPGAPVKADGEQASGRIVADPGETPLKFSEPGYFPYAVFLAEHQVLARGVSEPAVIVK